MVVLQQREHSSCPLLGFPFFFSSFSSRSFTLPVFLPWTCQQLLRDVTLTSTSFHQTLKEQVREGEGKKRRHHVNNVSCFLSGPVRMLLKREKQLLTSIAVFGHTALLQ